MYYPLTPLFTTRHKHLPNHSNTNHNQPERTTMTKQPTAKQKMTITLPSRLKRRLKDVSVDKGLTMNDFIIHALEDALNKSDGTYQNADLVADRLAQILNSQMAVITHINTLTQTIREKDL